MFDRALEITANIFRMSPGVWERHASPFSVWTRFATFPFIMLALWSIHWIGWWAALPIALLALWLTLNPRLFPPPAHTTSWAARGVMGERVYLARRDIPIPAHHVRAVSALTAMAVAGSVVTLAGLVWREPIAFMSGAIVTVLGKLWFVDRMVWLFDDMSRCEPRYAAWLR
jgi:hypothetical protein